MTLDAAARPLARGRPAVDADDETLIGEACRGDAVALECLLDRYRPLVRAKARGYFLVGADDEDVVQEGMIGLYKAVRDFDVERQGSFRAFAELCVTRQIISAIKTATRRKHVPLKGYVSLHLPAHEDEPDGELIDQLPAVAADPADRVVCEAELAELASYCGRALSDFEAEVLQRYVMGQSYAEIAGYLNRGVKSVDNAIQRIKRKLDEHLSGRLEQAG